MRMAQPSISGIFVYPVKSASQISLDYSKLEQRGLAYDRRWMVVDESGTFMTQRTSPTMALLKIEIEDQTLSLNAPGMSELSLPLFPKVGLPQEVEVWGDRCEAWAADKQSAGWISEYLGKNCNFVFMPASSNRPVDPDYAIGENQIAFSDGFPLLLISESSLNDLNSRLPEKISMKRFRPNLVVNNIEPFQEDCWKAIRIGDCELEVVKPCSRCVLTTVDPETGTFSGKEPLKTLATYRQLNGEVMFGQNLIPRALGKLEVGMPVEIISTN